MASLYIIFLNPSSYTIKIFQHLVFKEIMTYRGWNSTISKHSLSEYCEFAQHSLSSSTHLFYNNGLAFLVMRRSDSSFTKLLFNLRTSFNTSSLAVFSLSWRVSTKLIKSFFNNLSKDSSV